MSSPEQLELKNIGRVLRLDVAKRESERGMIRYMLDIRDVQSRTRLHYLLTPQELRALHLWATQELAYRAGAHNKRYASEPPF